MVKLNTTKRERSLFIISIVVPIMALYILFYIFPCIRGLYMSLFRWRGISMNMSFVGFKNFVELFKDRFFL